MCKFYVCVSLKSRGHGGYAIHCGRGVLDWYVPASQQLIGFSLLLTHDLRGLFSVAKNECLFGSYLGGFSGPIAKENGLISEMVLSRRRSHLGGIYIVKKSCPR